MKKSSLFTIGLLGILTAFAIGHSNVLAAQVELPDAAESPSEIVKTCGNFEPFKLPDEKIDALVFRIEFEKARSKYHDYIKCHFDFATKEIVGASGSLSDIFSSNAPILTDAIAKLRDPNSACIDQNDLNKILIDQSPKNLLPPLLDAYNQYAKHLVNLRQRNQGEQPIDLLGDFTQTLIRQDEFGLMIENELIKSEAALNQAFVSLKELRQSFTMHIHFQCMLRNLENYRRVFANFRKVITTLPSLIVDCSLHK